MFLIPLLIRLHRYPPALVSTIILFVVSMYLSLAFVSPSFSCKTVFDETGYCVNQVASFQLLWAIYRPTNTVQTLTLALHFVLLNPRSIVRMRNPSLVSLFALPVPILLFVTFHRMWLVTGNGNPNYIYFQCVAYCVFVSIITIDFIGATVKRDKVRRLVEKGDTVKYITEADKKMESEIKECSPDTSPGENAVSKSSTTEGEVTPEPNVVFL